MDTHWRTFAALLGSTNRYRPPSQACNRSPVTSKTRARASACGDVPLAPLQTTLCHGLPGSWEASPLKMFPLKFEHPLGLGNACRSPAMKTTFRSVGSAMIAPWILPCPPGKISGDGTPIAVHVVPSGERNTPLNLPLLMTAA